MTLSLVLSLNFSGIKSQVKLDIGYAFSPGALVIETRKSSGMFCAAPAAAAVTESRSAFTKLASLILDRPVGHFILNGVNQFDVSDRIWSLFYKPCDPFVPFPSKTNGPFD